MENLIGTHFSSTHVGCYRDDCDHPLQQGNVIDRHGRLARSLSLFNFRNGALAFRQDSNAKILTVVVIANFSLCSLRHRHFNAGSPAVSCPAASSERREKWTRENQSITDAEQSLEEAQSAGVSPLTWRWCSPKRFRLSVCRAKKVSKRSWSHCCDLVAVPDLSCCAPFVTSEYANYGMPYRWDGWWKVFRSLPGDWLLVGNKREGVGNSGSISLHVRRLKSSWQTFVYGLVLLSQYERWIRSTSAFASSCYISGIFIVVYPFVISHDYFILVLMVWLKLNWDSTFCFRVILCEIRHELLLH